MWSKERDFIAYIATKLKRAGATCYRIETGSTAVGVPDMYVLAKNDYWIEFKNSSASLLDGKWKINWRAEQKNFARTYCKYRKKYTWTFCGLRDGALLIRMTKNICTSNNEITVCDDVHCFDKKQLANLDIISFLANNNF